MCCPCLQIMRMVVFLWGRTFGCVIVTLSVCCAPCMCVLCQLFSSCCSIVVRYRLRQRLKIKGGCWQDCLIHVLLRPCALCQEAQELRVAGYSGVFYETEVQRPIAPVNVAASAALEESLMQEEPVPVPEPEPQPDPQLAATRKLQAVGRERPAQRRPTSRPLLQRQIRQEPEPQPLPEPVPVPEPQPEPEPQPAEIIPWGPGHPNW